MRDPVKLVGGVLIGLLLIVVFFMTYFTVPQNERAVVSRWGEFTYVAEPGLHFKIPFRDTVTFFPVGFQSLSSADKTWINTYTIDSQEVDVTFTVFYQVPPGRIQFIYGNNRDYEPKLYSMALDRVKAAFGGVNVQMVAEKRGELRDQIKKTLEHDAQQLGIEVTDFQLTNLQYTELFRNAINQAAVQKANIENVEYMRQQAEKQALTDRVKAEGTANAVREAARGAADAEVTRAEAAKKAAVLAADAQAYATEINGRAAARAIEVKGAAEATAIAAQGKALQEQSGLTELRKAERWDGKLPTAMYAGAPIPFMSMKAHDVP